MILSEQQVKDFKNGLVSIVDLLPEPTKWEVPIKGKSYNENGTGKIHLSEKRELISGLSEEIESLLEIYNHNSDDENMARQMINIADKWIAKIDEEIKMNIFDDQWEKN